MTLGARRHEIKHGARLTLHGSLNYANGAWPIRPGARTSMRVTVLARPDRRHPFRTVASVRPAALSAEGYPWTRVIRPHRTTIYLVEANSQPNGEQYWQSAQSKPFKVVVHR